MDSPAGEYAARDYGRIDDPEAEVDEGLDILFEPDPELTRQIRARTDKR